MTAYTYAFKRGKFSDLVALLSGRDFENGKIQKKLPEKVARCCMMVYRHFFNQTHYQRFLMLVNLLIYP